MTLRFSVVCSEVEREGRVNRMWKIYAIKYCINPENWDISSATGVIPMQIFFDKQGLVQGYSGLA